jgi:hypothetical protein
MFKKIDKNYIKYLIILVVWYAIFLRLYNLWIQSFWIDEGFSSYVSMEFFEKWWDFKKPEYYLHNISQVINFNLLWISDFSARLPSVLFSVLNILLVYLISINLWKDKKIAIISVLIFSFLTWEIIWARQARFYTLLQLLFSINIYYLIKIVKDFSFKYLYLWILFSYIWILFHPFLYSNVAILFLWLIYLFYLNYKKINLKDIKYQKYLYFLLPFLIVLSVEFIKKYLTDIKWVGVPSSFELPDSIKEQRFPKYYGHLYWELGLLVPFSIIAMIYFIFKKKVLESIIFTFTTVFIFYVIAYKWKLFHTRYMLILYPLIIMSSSYIIFYVYTLIRDEFLNKFYLIIIWLLIISTANFTFFTKTNYFIDYTSPQPNFKWAYNIIPKNSKIISGFPMLCEWYYWNRWKCIYSISIDYVWDKTQYKKLLARKRDNYTDIRYLTNINQLKKNKQYYFVLDSLTIWGFLDKDLLKKVLKKSTLIYDNWKEYNRILVLEYKNK